MGNEDRSIPALLRSLSRKKIQQPVRLGSRSARFFHLNSQHRRPSPLPPAPLPPSCPSQSPRLCQPLPPPPSRSAPPSRSVPPAAAPVLRLNGGAKESLQSLQIPSAGRAVPAPCVRGGDVAPPGDAAPGDARGQRFTLSRGGAVARKGLQCAVTSAVSIPPASSLSTSSDSQPNYARLGPPRRGALH